MGKLLTSHRSTVYPCYLPVLGEFNRSWSYKTCPSRENTHSLDFIKYSKNYICSNDNKSNMTLDQSTDKIDAPINPNALKAGLLLAAFSIVFSLVIYFTGNITSDWANWTSVPFVLFIIYYFQKKFRDERQNGYITFGKAWKFGFAMSAVSTVFSAIYTYIIYSVDDSITDAVLEKSYDEMMASGGMNATQAEQALEMTEKMITPGMMIIWVLVFGLIFSLIWPLITSAIVQRKHPLD